MYHDNDPAYLKMLDKLTSELRNYQEIIGQLHDNRLYGELKSVTHNIRNIAGLLGQTNLKIMATYWEGLCDSKTPGNINELRLSIENAVKSIEKNDNSDY